jgi:hypothetical protein
MGRRSLSIAVETISKLTEMALEVDGMLEEGIYDLLSSMH